MKENESIYFFLARDLLLRCNTRNCFFIEIVSSLLQQSLDLLTVVENSSELPWFSRKGSRDGEKNG